MSTLVWFRRDLRLDDNPATSTADKMQQILLDLTGTFTGTDLGDGANDIIDGGDDAGGGAVA